jgi:hypothetical protein
MPRKPPRPRKTSDPEQLKRFIATAREVEADESAGAMDKALGRVMGRQPKTATPRPGQNRSRRSPDAEGSQQ